MFSRNIDNSIFLDQKDAAHATGNAADDARLIDQSVVVVTVSDSYFNLRRLPIRKRRIHSARRIGFVRTWCWSTSCDEREIIYNNSHDLGFPCVVPLRSVVRRRCCLTKHSKNTLILNRDQLALYHTRPITRDGQQHREYRNQIPILTLLLMLWDRELRPNGLLCVNTFYLLTTFVYVHFMILSILFLCVLHGRVRGALTTA